MMRTRLVWFSVGFASTAAVFSQLVWKDLWVDRHALTSDIEHHFRALDARISNLESSSSSSSPSSFHNHNHNNKTLSDQVEG